MKVLVLGAGKMTEAILVGLQDVEDLSDWLIYSPSGKSAEALAKKVGAKFVSDLNFVSDPEWVLVGCKPQQLKDLKVTLQGRFKKSLYVSLLAAILEEDQRDILGVERLIRVMPNLPVRFKKGTILLASLSASKELRIFQDMFSQVGMAITIGQEELEELTLLTGSGPAFFYEFTQALSHNFQSLDHKQRQDLARQVLLGAAYSASASKNQGLDEMIDSVTSKGGVTIAVLEKWRELNLTSLMKEGILAGKHRATQLRELLRHS